MSKNPVDLIPVREARALVGISDYKMTALIKAGIVATYLNPLDRRVKYVSRAEVLKLKETYERAA
jgi:hypothetical protein